jgi:hypothetical protein
VLSVKMNDAAVETLGVLSGFAAIEPPEGLASGLQNAFPTESCAAGRC